MKDFKNVTFKISDDIALSELNDESIALNLDSGKYFQLNELATFIFKNLESFTCIDNLKKNVLEKFDVSNEDCEADILDFLEKLHEQKLLDFH
tara:strand:- start:366 stop:644 length:279 start_codon:yes stop_codon:yes gene_type:complete